jgi:hypothetical protein
VDGRVKPGHDGLESAGGRSETAQQLRRASRVLETFIDSAHIGQMNEDHQITVLVEPDLLRPGRYRWTLLHSGQAQDRSEMSFATKREADADAEKVLKRRIAAWKAG